MTSQALVLKDEDRASASFLQINLAYPKLKQVSRDPPIFEVPDFLTKEECDALVAAGLPGLKRSIVVDAAAGKSAAPSRTSESCYLDKSAFSWLHAKVQALTTKSIETHEPPQVGRYSIGEFYLAHFDAFDITAESGRECCACGGQRVATVLVYLNTLPSEECGGATAFPRLGRKFFPRQGTAVVFFPCTTDAKLDPFALHAAESIKEDPSAPGVPVDKLVSQIWIRQRAYERPPLT